MGVGWMAQSSKMVSAEPSSQAGNSEEEKDERSHGHFLIMVPPEYRPRLAEMRQLLSYLRQMLAQQESRL